MKITNIKVGILETNCYILEKDNEVLIVDPGDDYDRIIKEIGNKKILGILITHRHFDHIGALNNFNNIKVYDKNNLEEKEYQINKFIFNVIFTPGHSVDSITFYFKKENLMFVGDFIFKDSIGRTDLPTGDMLMMNYSITKIMTYPQDTILYPGHGEITILKEEIKHNPFFNKGGK